MSIESFEKQPKILGKISIMRHGATNYTNEFPDLTERGIEQVRERGRELKEKIKPEKEDILYAASPAVRAQGTMSFILEELDEKEADVKVLDSTRPVKIRNFERAKEMVGEVMQGTNDTSKFDKAYATDKIFENTPDVWQPKSEVEERFYRGLEYLIRSLLKYRENPKEGKIPHLVAVSHFEFLNHFVMEVFGLDPEKDDLLGFAEMIEMEIMEPSSDEPDNVPIKVTFRGQSKNVVFDRKNRTII